MLRNNRSSQLDALFVKITPNRWDILAFGIVVSIFGLCLWGGKQMFSPYQLGQPLLISLAPQLLPKYGILTLLRMLIAMGFSLLFTFIFATWAAKSKRASQIIIPCIDILQSVPVLGFVSMASVVFMRLFPNSRLGLECAAIFAIFTAQAWNMSLSFYQSLCSIPTELKEATYAFHLSSWQRFWRLEVPFAMPGLLTNMMLSMSGSWVFLVASESISISNQTITLPGLGSYIELAIAQANSTSLIYGILAMLTIIILYDQLFFRPLLDWSKKFVLDHLSPEQASHPWITLLLKRTAFFKYLSSIIRIWLHAFITIKINKPQWFRTTTQRRPNQQKLLNVIWFISLVFIGLTSIWVLTHSTLGSIPLKEWRQAIYLGGITAARVLIAITIASLICLPVGVTIGLRPPLMRTIQPIVQFFAAFPANVLTPLIVNLLIHYNLPMEIGTLGLMLLGSQWYILFNVIAGAAAIPEDLRQTASSFNLKGWLWWKRLILPGIFPHYMTGIVTAVGNAWNISVLAELFRWGSTTLNTPGLGAYITLYKEKGDLLYVTLGIVVMSLWVLLMNYLIWRPLYRLAQSRYRLD